MTTTSAPRPFRSRVLVTAVGNFFPPLAVLVMAPFLAQALGVAGRGELAAATAPYLLAISLGTLGLPDAITQAIASGYRLSKASWRVVATLTAGSGATVSVILLITAPVLAYNGGDIVRPLIIIAGAGTIAALAVAIARAIAAGHDAWRLIAAERIANGVIKIVGTICLSLTGQLTLLSATILIAYAPIAAGLVYALLPKVSRVSSVHELALPGETVAFGLKAWVGSAAGVLLMRVNQLLIMPLAGAPQLGLYAVAVNISEIPLIASGAIREVTFSADARHRDNDRLVLTARLNLIICALMSLPLLVSMGWWMPWIFGPEFRSATPATIVLAIAVLSGVPGSIAGSSLAARGHPELRSRSILFGCVFNIAAVFALVPNFGALGASFAFLIGTVVSSNGSIYFASTRFGMRFTDFYRLRSSDAVQLKSALQKILSRS